MTTIQANERFTALRGHLQATVGKTISMADSGEKDGIVLFFTDGTIFRVQSTVDGFVTTSVQAAGARMGRIE